VKLIVQPDDGIAPLIDAIREAQKSVEIVIFRFDENEMEEALKAAVERGIFVSALIAHANRGGEDHLRELEMRFLDGGITVARTARDLVRYHDKMMLIDRSTLILLSFNYTLMDINHSRGFGVVTQDRDLVQHAQRLFDADARRQAYSPALKTFLVSPLNARKELRTFIRGARRQLLIYDPKISDPEMIRLLSERAKAGVEIKIIGGLGRRANGLTAQKLSQMNLHTRTIIRDGDQAYIGSASLRKAELDSRREVGIIVHEPAVIRGLQSTFQSDWRPPETDPTKPDADLEEVLEKTVQTIADEIPPLATTVKKVVKKAVERAGPGVLADKKVQAALKKVVRKAVKETMKETLKEIVEESLPEPPIS
jgi:cardiolipin synthase A/B